MSCRAWNKCLKFFDAKRKYAQKQEGENAGEFLQLVSGGTFLPDKWAKKSN